MNKNNLLMIASTIKTCAAMAACGILALSVMYQNHIHTIHWANH